MEFEIFKLALKVCKLGILRVEMAVLGMDQTFKVVDHLF